MSAIMIRFEREQRVDINEEPISSNRFQADFLLVPDDVEQSEYGNLRMTISGDSTRLSDLTQTELNEWIKDGVIAMLSSETSQT